MFPTAARPLLRLRFLATIVLALCGFGCSAAKPTAAPATPLASVVARPAERIHPVMLGIDVLEADGFVAVRGKRL